MAWDDVFSGGLQGGGVGALAGSPFGPLGAGIGGGIGALYGGYQGYKRGKAKEGQKKTLADAQARLEELKSSQYAQRMADIDKAMSYFGPTDALMKEMYGGKKR